MMISVEWILKSTNQSPNNGGGEGENSDQIS